MASAAAMAVTGHRMSVASLRPVYNSLTSSSTFTSSSSRLCHVSSASSSATRWRSPLLGTWTKAVGIVFDLKALRPLHSSRIAPASVVTLASAEVRASGTTVQSAPAATAPGQAIDVNEKPSWRASIDFKWIRDNKESIATNIVNRNSGGDVEAVVQLYEESIKLGMAVEKLRAERNAVANAMKGKLEKSKRDELISKGKLLKDQLAGLEQELDLLSDKLQQEGQKIPNMTHPSVPLGSEEFAAVRKVVGSQREFAFPVKDHVDLGLALDLFEFEAAAEVSGTKFYYLKNEAVLLEMALVNWTMAQLRKKGFVLLSTPDLVRSTVVEKCGFQPRGKTTQVYSVEGTDLCLAGTAEILVGGLYMDSVLPEASLPLRLVAFSHCFRTEAGAAGLATRGLYRVHQFSKVEMFGISRPEESEALLEELITIEEDLYTALGLHFKTLDMASEDLGAPAYRKYDVEAWMPGLGRYGEISSASNCTDYQARRLNIKFRPEAMLSDGLKTKLSPLRFAHTLNATACAVPRMIIAILENNQQADGSIVIPEVLQPFMGGLKIISPKEK